MSDAFIDFLEKMETARTGRPTKVQPWQRALIDRLMKRALEKKRTDAVQKVMHAGKPYLVGIDLAKPGTEKSVACVFRLDGKKATLIVVDEIAYSR